jgi:hypothetical protein
MPGLAEFLGHFAGNFGSRASSLFDQLGQQAIGGPQGWAQEQENQRQANQLQAQQEAGQQAQQNWQQEFSQKAQQLAQGQQQQQFENTRQTAGDTLTGQRDLISALQGGFSQTGSATPDSVQLGSTFLTPPAKNRTMDLSSDSPLGKAMGLTDDIKGVPLEDYLKYTSQYADKMGLNQNKQASIDQLNAMAPDIEKQINSRFSPEYYKIAYPWATPQDLQYLQANGEISKQNYLNALKTGLISDKKTMSNTELSTLQRNLGSDISKNSAEKFMDEKHSSQLRIGESKAMQFSEYPDVTPAQIKQWSDSVESQGTKMLTTARQVNPKLAMGVETELGKRGTNLLNLTTQEQDNRGKANVALDQLQRAQNILDQPGVEDRLGPLSSRWKSFMAGEVGSSNDPQWKSIHDALVAAKGAATNIHYGVRGGSSPAVMKLMGTILDPDKMDAPTLRVGISSLRSLLQDYAQEGQAGPSIQGALGLAPTQSQSAPIPFKAPTK